MTIIDASLTRRSEIGAAAVDGAASPHGFGMPGSAGASTGIPGRFAILSQIGSGGMGIVFKVRDLETGEIVALKLLKPEIASDPQMREELRKEVCLARRVTHKNVCRIHEFYRSDEASCISMEFVDGETLLSKLHRVGALPVADAIEITRQICAGLREAHARGIVHRDLKPANILIDRSGVVKIMDFGIARLSLESGQLTRTIVGTPEYMAPEQIEIKAMGPRTDIYSVGLLLYEMLTGTQAFSGDSIIAVALKQIRESPKRPSEIVSTLSPGLEAVVLKCLRKNCDSRFQSVDKLDAALCKVAASAAPNPIVTRFGTVAEYASSKWRVFVPQLAHFGGELYRVTHHLSQTVSSESKRLALLAFTSVAPDRRKNRWIQIAAIAGAAVLSFVLFALVAGKPTNHEPATPETIILPSFENTEAAVLAPPASVSPAPSITPAEPVEDASHQSADRSLPMIRTSDDSSTNVSLVAVTSADDIPRPNTPTAEPAKKRTKRRQISTPPPVKINPNAANVGPILPDGASRPSPLDQTAGIADAAIESASASAPQPAAHVTASSASTKPGADEPASIAKTYLEVGSFKDTKWADDAVERLSKLGFHAICVHKTVLWMQSYHVQVGPYVASDQIDNAQKRLAEQGITSHIVK